MFTYLTAVRTLSILLPERADVLQVDLPMFEITSYPITFRGMPFNQPVILPYCFLNIQAEIHSFTVSVHTSESAKKTFLIIFEIINFYCKTM